MNIWITGSSGFLGGRLALGLRSEGHRVLGLSRRAPPNAQEGISIDLSDNDAPQELNRISGDWGRPDTVIHSACLKPGTGSLTDHVKSNVMTTANLIEALANFPPQQMIYISTLSVNFLPELNATDNGITSRNDLPYLVTKKCSEQLVQGFQSISQVTVLRLPSLYGVGQTDSFIDGLARMAKHNQTIELFGRGETVREALHVGDAVTAIISCVQKPPTATFSCLSLGCGQKITTREYVEALVAAMTSSSPIVPVDRPSTQKFDLLADISDAQSIIGFSPSSLSKAMEKYARELQTQP